MPSQREKTFDIIILRTNLGTTLDLLVNQNGIFIEN